MDASSIAAPSRDPWRAAATALAALQAVVALALLLGADLSLS